jgi:hypothetical protein
MYYRLTRSAITILILSLAVAFLSYVLYFGVISYDTEYLASKQLTDTRKLSGWVSRLSSPDEQLEILRSFQRGNQARIVEYRRWGALSDQDVSLLTQAAPKLGIYRSYFDQIPKTARAVLIADTDPFTLAEHLRDSSKFDEFTKAAAKLSLKLPLDDRTGFRSLITGEFPLFGGICERIRTGQAHAIVSVLSGEDKRPIQSRFVQADPALLAAIRGAGFAISDSAFRDLCIEAKTDLAYKQIALAFKDKRIGPLIARQTGRKLDKLDIAGISSWLTTPARAKWLSAALGKVPGYEEFTGERLLSLAAGYRRVAALQAVAPEISPEKRTGVFALSSTSLWLVLVSFLVCLIGIMNTMLMSVAERFSEIATMKCLGAMDGFVMLQFVFEALLQGVAGSLVGVVLGLILAFMRGGLSYGSLVFESVDFGAVFVISSLSFLAGIAIAAVAAMGPSWTASRLAPMEAMRVE